MANTYLDPILSRCEHEPQRLFARFYDGGDWRPVSYGQLSRRAGEFAHHLRSSGVRAGETVFLILQYGFDAHAAFLGAMLCGAVPSFLPHPSAKQDTALYWSQHREIFSLIAPRAIVVYDDLKDPVSDALENSEIVVIGLSDVRTNDEPLRSVSHGTDAIALVQHSSGTTGLKKGTALSYRAICAQIEAYAATLALNEVREVTVATWLPLYHDMGLISSFLMPLWLGLPIVGIDPFLWVANPSLLLEAVERFRATHLWCPNFAFQHLVRAVPRKARFDLSSIKAMINCSEPCKPASFDRFLERFAADGITNDALQTCYAMAETVFAVSQSPVDRPVRRIRIDASCVGVAGPVRPPQGSNEVTLLSNGPPIRGCEVAVARDGAFVAEREVGEICVRAPFLFDGYHKNAEATRASFLSGWYHTGDLGFLDTGEVFVVGRLKDLIIVNGKNIFAHDVEAALVGIRDLKPGRSVAFGHYVEAVGSEQLIVVGEREGEIEQPSKLIAEINRIVVNEFGIPCGDVRIVDPGWLIKTTSGKISRSLNSAKYTRTFRAHDRPGP